MNFINRIIDICSSNVDEIDAKNNSVRQLAIFNYFNLSSIALLLIFTIINYFKEAQTIYISTAILLVITTTNFLFFRKNKNYRFSSLLFVFSFSVFFVGTIYLKLTSTQGVLIYSGYPILAHLFLGKQKGNIANLFFFIAMITTLFLPDFTNISFSFSISIKILFIFSYLIFFIFINILEQFREEHINALNVKIQQEKEKSTAKEEFISKISHQIRTPLNNIVVVTNLVSNYNVDRKFKDLIDTIQASTNNLVNVVNNITELSNVDLVQSKDYNQNFDLESTIKNTVNLFTNENSNIDIFINSDIHNTIYGDPVKIKQIFLSLIENILKNSKIEKKTITIDVNEQSNTNEYIELMFKVCTNDLLNITEITKIRNTEKTRQAKNESFIKLLELKLVQQIIETQGGGIEVELTPDNFEFHFVLKFKKEELTPELPQNEILTNIDPQQKINLKDANVLLVEDNLINQKIVLLSLKKSVKSVDVANNGKEALDKFGSAKYDIILMDIQMPIMNGIITTQKIRSIERSTNSHTPIIAITANALLGDKEECIAAGMDDYISKPFQIETLINKMKEHL
ncbi:MAG: response regulator [Bacteroidales bacterium]|nr:response regulator [Bacteroidales bacterium]